MCMIDNCKILFLSFIHSLASQINALTCPGFPGYCSESFVGSTCVVVCSKGRPNVPLCQVSFEISLVYPSSKYQ